MEVVSGQPFTFAGGPQAVILLHSYTSSSADVRLLGRDLQRAGYTVYAPVFAGHGQDPLTVLQAGSPAKWWIDTSRPFSKCGPRGWNKLLFLGSH